MVKSVQLAVGTNSEFVHQDDGAEVQELCSTPVDT